MIRIINLINNNFNWQTQLKTSTAPEPKWQNHSFKFSHSTGYSRNVSFQVSHDES